MAIGGRVVRVLRKLNGGPRSTSLLGDWPRALRMPSTVLWLAAAVFAVASILPAIASASLPDNRVYELVSPPDLDGNEVLPEPGNFASVLQIGLSSEEGDAVMFASTGAVGKTTNNGGIQEDIARRTPGVGWSTTPADSRELGGFGFIHSPQWPSFYPNRSFSKVFFDTASISEWYEDAYSPEEPAGGFDAKLYLSENPFEPAIWVGKPTAKNPIPALGGPTSCHCERSEGEGPPVFRVTGVSPGGTIYFMYSGTLLPEDEEPRVEIVNAKDEKELIPGGRSEHVGAGRSQEPNDAWGFYEWQNGQLSEAGVLPNGKLSPYGAVGAALAYSGGWGYLGAYEKEAEEGHNQTSEDGSRAFFESPDPQALQVEGTPPNTTPSTKPEVPEVYVREALPSGGHKSVLVSRDELLKDVKEKDSDGTELEYPAQAPEGAKFLYASPDGSQAFISSSDKLVNGLPSHSELELNFGYEFSGGTFTLSVTANGSTQTTAPIPQGATPAQIQSALEALSNLGGSDVSVGNGSYPGPPVTYLVSFPGLEPSITINTTDLEGSGTPAVNNVTIPYVYDFDVETEKLTYLPDVSTTIYTSSQNGSRIMFRNLATSSLELWTEGGEGGKTEAIIKFSGNEPQWPRASNNGNVFLFDSYPEAELSQFNNGGGEQIYRYEVSSKEITCVSCPAHGVIDTGTAEVPNTEAYNRTVQPVRIISADGSRVFFQSSGALVPAAVNGMTNVYEWENGHIYLISGGTAITESHYVDSSETGGDVFFETEEGLVPAGEDEQVNVYDARIPRPGDNPPPTQTPCSGDVCQGPPSVPQLLTPGASATFKGLGNIPPEAEEKPVTKVVKKTLAKKKKKKAKKKAKKMAKKAKKGKRARKSDRRGK